VRNYHSELSGNRGVPEVKVSPHEWRIDDEGESWERKHGNHYYRNEYEDPGSTSVILHDERRAGASLNFKPWRAHVSEAIRMGSKVPSHVEALYHATGGEAGPVTSHLPDYKEPSKAGRMDDISRQHLPEPVRNYATTEQVLQEPNSTTSHWSMGLYEQSAKINKAKKELAQKQAMKLKPKGT
jgi:hypothetical protein